MRLIVGSNGLVGKSLLEQGEFDLTFNSKDTIVSEDGDELWLSCLPATKWQVNQNLDSDIDNLNNIIQRIRYKRYSKVVLISTIDVYCESPFLSTEQTIPQFSKLSYGHNRYLFELMVSTFIDADDLKIIRLPALYNKNIKKNILFDLFNDNNVNKINANSSFQWYNLDTLLEDITCLTNLYPERTVFNFFTEPVNTADIINLFPEHKHNVDYTQSKSEYNYCTDLASSGYLYSKQESLKLIERFVNEARSNKYWV